MNNKCSKCKLLKIVELSKTVKDIECPSCDKPGLKVLYPEWAWLECECKNCQWSGRIQGPNDGQVSSGTNFYECLDCSYIERRAIFEEKLYKWAKCPKCSSEGFRWACSGDTFADIRTDDTRARTTRQHKSMSEKNAERLEAQSGSFQAHQIAETQKFRQELYEMKQDTGTHPLEGLGDL